MSSARSLLRQICLVLLDYCSFSKVCSILIPIPGLQYCIGIQNSKTCSSLASTYPRVSQTAATLNQTLVLSGLHLFLLVCLLIIYHTKNVKLGATVKKCMDLGGFNLRKTPKVKQCLYKLFELTDLIRVPWTLIWPTVWHQVKET